MNEAGFDLMRNVYIYIHIFIILYDIYFHRFGVLWENATNLSRQHAITSHVSVSTLWTLRS